MGSGRSRRAQAVNTAYPAQTYNNPYAAYPPQQANYPVNPYSNYPVAPITNYQQPNTMIGYNNSFNYPAYNGYQGNAYNNYNSNAYPGGSYKVCYSSNPYYYSERHEYYDVRRQY